MLLGKPSAWQESLTLLPSFLVVFFGGSIMYALPGMCRGKSLLSFELSVGRQWPEDDASSFWKGTIMVCGLQDWRNLEGQKWQSKLQWWISRIAKMSGNSNGCSDEQQQWLQWWAAALIAVKCSSNGCSDEQQWLQWWAAMAAVLSSSSSSSSDCSDKGKNNIKHCKDCIDY